MTSRRASDADRTQRGIGGALHQIQPERVDFSAELEDDMRGEVNRHSREYVRWVQQWLNKLMGLQLAGDGVMGPQTRSAIRSFQQRQGLTVDGLVSPPTERALIALGASPPPGTGIPINIQVLQDNIVKLANQEWQRWGRGTIKEWDQSIRPVLQDYWLTGIGVRHSEPDWWSKYYWSAAFISWIMRKAGAGNAFRYSGKHARYIKAAKDNQLANSANPFKAYRISKVAPRVGDLVCKARAGSGATYENIRDHDAHCDIVTAVQPNRLTTIGGNVNQSVSRTSVPTNADGYISQPGYFAVIRLSPPAPSGTLEVEPFEAYAEFDGEWEGDETELADEEWEQEARPGVRIPSRTTGFRQPPFRRPPQVRRRRPPRLPWSRLGWPVAVIREPSVVEPAPEGSEYVRWVQSSLNTLMSLRLPVDGIMGPETRSAIRSFQQRQGLPVNGIVGPETQRALIAAGASQPPETGEFSEAYSAFDNQLEYSMGAAAVCKPDLATNGQLCSFNSRHGGSTTAVYVPDAARNTDPLSLLVWIHGLLICGDEKDKNAVAYVKSKTFPLAKQLADSKRPFVLVVPSMNWKKGQTSHMLGSPQTMNAFLEEVRTKLTAAGWSSAPSFGRLILAGHSKAYAVLNGLAARVSDAQSSQGALAKLTDVWLLDTTYGAGNKKALVTSWMRWAKAKSRVNLRILYRRNSATAAVAEGIRDEAAKARLTNVDVKDFDPKALTHCAMPRALIPDLLRRGR